MKTILIIGASILQVPAIIKAKELGLRVVVVDINSNAIGIAYADDYYNVSTIDQEGILKVAQIVKPDGIMTLATDMPMRSIAYISEKMNLPGISMCTAIKATDKIEMIKAFKQNDVACPWFFTLRRSEDIEKISSFLTYPCIMKPSDNAGSRGVIKINTIDELKNNFEYSLSNSRNGDVLVEEYLVGEEVSVEVIVYKGKVNILAITDKITTGPPHFVELGHTQPTMHNPETIKSIEELTVKAIQSIGLENGTAHVEMMITSQGPKMIELGARLGGDCITTHLVPLSTGIDMVQATIDIALNRKPDLDIKFKKGSAIRFFNPNLGILRDIVGIEETRNIEGVKEIVFTKKTGDIIPKIESSVDRCGYVIVQGDDRDTAINIANYAIQNIKIIVS